MKNALTKGVGVIGVLLIFSPAASFAASPARQAAPQSDGYGMSGYVGSGHVWCRNADELGQAIAKKRRFEELKIRGECGFTKHSAAIFTGATDYAGPSDWRSGNSAWICTVYLFDGDTPTTSPDAVPIAVAMGDSES